MKPKLLLALYFIALLGECIAVVTASPLLHFISKPLLMPLLAFYYFVEARSYGQLDRFILGALLFSWTGDVVLMLDKLYGGLFIYGLLGFLGAHICYIVYFVSARKNSPAPSALRPASSLLVLAYMALFYVYILPGLGGLAIPVLIYAIVITLMLISSINAFDVRNQLFGRLCVFGAMIFAVSDSILAINRFVSPFRYAPVFIMLTYGVAQVLIVSGAIKAETPV